MTAPATTAAPPHTADVRTFDGDFLVWKLEGKTFRRSAAAHYLPRCRHKTMAAAVAEATRLSGLFPESTFVVIQEVARVKRAPALGIAA